MSTEPAAAPLTHHDILALVGPYARAGLQVDLAASDRLKRRIAFRAVEHPAADGGPPLRETLSLEVFRRGGHRLTRTLHHPDGGQASAQAQGAQPEALLARLRALPVQAQFRQGPGWRLALSYTLDEATPVLQRGVVRAEGLELVMTLLPVRGAAAEITLMPVRDPSPALPQDLLAVLGWDWTRLVPERAGWRSRLRLRGGLARRTRKAEQALEAAAVHLARTLAGTPRDYHERHYGARLLAMCRRAIPLLTPVALALTVILMPRLNVEASPTWLLLYHVPTVLIALAFRLQEMPALEIPPWPRVPGQGSWWPQVAGRAPAQA